MVNFTPFNQQHFRELERQFQELTSTIPTEHDFRGVPRGYAEINKLFYRSMANGRRRNEACIQKEALSDHDHKVLATLQSDLGYDIATIAHDMNIPQDGYTLRVTNRQVMITGTGKEYYLLAQILDSDMRSTIIAPGCVESFYSAPVALFVSYSPCSYEPSCAPLVTALAFREMSQRLRNTQLDELKREWCPTFAYSLVCAAIERREKPPVSPSTEGGAGQATGLRLDFYFMPPVDVGVSQQIQKIEFVSRYFDPTFSVTRNLGTGVETTHVQLRRSAQFGQVGALVLSSNSHG